MFEADRERARQSLERSREILAKGKADRERLRQEKEARTFKPWARWMRPTMRVIIALIVIASLLFFFASDTSIGPLLGVLFLTLSILSFWGTEASYRYQNSHIDPKYLSRPPD